MYECSTPKEVLNLGPEVKALPEKIGKFVETLQKPLTAPYFSTKTL